MIPRAALHDEELAGRVLAELADPLHPDALDLTTVRPTDFYELRDQRIARVLVARRTAGKSPVGTDRAVVFRLFTLPEALRLWSAIQHAWPLTPVALDRFLHLAALRRRLRELEAERERIMEAAA